MGRGRRQRGKLAGALSRRTLVETSDAGNALREIGSLWETPKLRRRSSMRDLMLVRQNAADRVLETERHRRWVQAGATEAFMEHVLPHLPSTRAQRALLIGLVDPTGDATLTRSRRWEQASTSLTQGQVLKWISALRAHYIAEADPTSGTRLKTTVVDIQFELDKIISVRGIPAAEQCRPAHCLLNAARTIAQLDSMPGFPTERDFEVALDRDRAENRFERDDDGLRAREFLVRVGKWGAHCVADGTLRDLTYADLGLDHQGADSYMRTQMEFVRRDASRFPIATADGAARYLQQAGLNGRLSGHLSAALNPRYPYVVTTLALGVKTAMETTYGTVMPTPEQTGQIATWLRSTESTSTQPVENFFMAPHYHGTAIGLAHRANLSRFSASAPNAGTPAGAASGAGTQPRVSPPRRKMRPLRTFPSATPRRPSADASPADSSAAPSAATAGQTTTARIPKMRNLANPSRR